MPVANDHHSEGRTGLGLLVENPELENALAHGLDLPLAALRASMESLNDSLPIDAEGRGALQGALDEIRRLGRNVRDLMELASPPRPMPLRCTASEIVLSARDELPRELRSRIVVARIAAGGAIHTDAPLLARCLRRLIENALEAGSEQVLVVVRRERGTTRFSVIDGSSTRFDSNWAASAFHSTKEAHLGLGLSIATRDIELMNGTLVVLRSDLGETCVTVTIPDAFEPSSTIDSGKESAA